MFCIRPYFISISSKKSPQSPLYEHQEVKVKKTFEECPPCIGPHQWVKIFIESLKDLLVSVKWQE